MDPSWSGTGKTFAACEAEECAKSSLCGQTGPSAIQMDSGLLTPGSGEQFDGPKSFACPSSPKSEFRLKSRLMDSAQGRGLGRDRRSWPKMAKTASKVFCVARGANKPKLLTACL
jgi:hypothetical protein